MKLTKLKLIYHILFTKNFFSHPLGGLKETIEYAIKNYETKRGEGATNVLHFENKYYRPIK